MTTSSNALDTTSPKAQSWVESANSPTTDFPIQNLPYCCFFRPEDGASHLAVRIGDKLFSLTNALDSGLFESLDFGDNQESFLAACDLASADLLGGLTTTDRRVLRERIFALLLKGSKHAKTIEKECLFIPQEVVFEMPVSVQNYTDFYASINHASTVGSMFRPDNPLLPNYKWVPIGYHGRASSVNVERGPIVRPHGQSKADDAAAPTFGPCKMLDYELEVGCIIAKDSDLGTPIPIAQAFDHVLGFCLVNDWSARDMQKWEYQPLGPFLAKNFATTISPYIVTPEALEPFRCPAASRPEGDPQPLPYLLDQSDQSRGSFDLTLEVLLESAAMRNAKVPPMRLSLSNAFKDLYWTFGQMIAHHSSNGCNLMQGDLIASGTISGSSPDSRGCLLELTWTGTGQPRKPITLPTGETRTFLQDGDAIILRGWCERPGATRIGFGECRGEIKG